MIIKYIWEGIITKLLSNERFVECISDLVLDVYRKESLQITRVWGNESRIIVGSNVELNDALINTVCGSVSIGDDSFMGHGVYLLTGTHDYSKKGLERQRSVPEFGRDIVIGKGVWIASRAIVLAPCIIGDNAVIAAGSVVTGDVKSNGVYAGSPAKLLRLIGSMEEKF
jgi:acetyltransferase-like isoleucine patch superfamily enzyme